MVVTSLLLLMTLHKLFQDGIGYWCNADGLSRTCNVFTYYCYIGYPRTDGGKVPATNGNNPMVNMVPLLLDLIQTKLPTC